MKKRKSHITLPRSYDPGPGYPRETLAYLSEAEHELIRKLTDGKWNRGPKGVRSYADDSASSKGVSRGDNSGTKGSGGLGQGGQGSGGSAGSKSGGSSGASSSSSSSASKSSSSGSSSSSSSSSSGAGRDSSRGIGQGAGGSAIGRGGASTATGKAAEAAKANAAKASAPNAAAQAAYDKQTMRAVSQRHNPVTPGGALHQAGLVSGAMPSDYVRAALGYNVNSMLNRGVTDVSTFMDGYNNLKQFKDVGYSPAGVQKIRDNLGYTPVGIRTNNPGNILNSGWQKSMPGYTGPVTSPNGLTYASYTDPRWGLVAQNELLGRYYDGGRTTINSVVDRYAPVDENNSAAANRSYKEHLSNATGWGREQELTREQVQALGPHKTSFENGGALFAGGPFGGVSGLSSGTQVAGIANAGLTQAAAEARANKATTGLDAIQKAATLPSAFAGDPRLGVPQGAFPAAPLRSTAGTYTTPYNPEVQGPLRYGGPLDKIPTPNSTGYATLMTPAFAADPRLSVPQGSYPAAPPKSAFASDPRLSVPQGAYPAAKPPSAFAADPRLSIPQGAYPAAKPPSAFAEDPRLSVPQGAYPAAPPPSAFASDPRLSVPQGAYPASAQTTVASDPRLSQTPVGSYPAAPPASVFANDPRLGVPQGAYPARAQTTVAGDPRLSQTPLGAFPAAQKPASVFAEDPRVATTPLGSLPAAKPKETQLAWNVPPMGGALPGQAAWGLGLWGTNRPLPTGPGAQPGTIHSQTADATSAPPASEDKPSFWQQAGDLYNTASTAAKEKVEEIKQDPGFKFAQKYPRLAEFALKMMMGGGGTPNPNGFGNPQDRSGYVTRPQIPQAPQMAQAQGGVSTDPLTILTNLQANMIAQGASPEELAYVQSIIDELTNSQVA